MKKKPLGFDYGGLQGALNSFLNRLTIFKKILSRKKLLS